MDGTNPPRKAIIPSRLNTGRPSITAVKKSACHKHYDRLNEYVQNRDVELHSHVIEDWNVTHFFHLIFLEIV